VQHFKGAKVLERGHLGRDKYARRRHHWIDYSTIGIFHLGVTFTNDLDHAQIKYHGIHIKYMSIFGAFKRASETCL